MLFINQVQRRVCLRPRKGAGLCCSHCPNHWLPSPHCPCAARRTLEALEPPDPRVRIREIVYKFACISLVIFQTTILSWALSTGCHFQYALPGESWSRTDCAHQHYPPSATIGSFEEQKWWRRWRWSIARWRRQTHNWWTWWLDHRTCRSVRNYC